MPVFSKSSTAENVVLGQACVLADGKLPKYCNPEGSIVYASGDVLAWAVNLEGRYLVGPSGTNSWEAQ